MKQHSVAGTGLAVSRICLGTMTFGSQVDAATAAAMIDLSIDHGVNFVDTANVYNGGASESILGQVLSGRRDRVVLASKVGIPVGKAADQIGLSPATVRRQVEESLRRLRTDYLDVYYLHQPDASTPLEETLQAVDHLVKSGKVRCVGASNYASWQVCEMLWSADRQGYEPVRLVQPMYNLLARGIEQEFLPMCARFGLSTVVYNPLAGGLLTGKYGPAEPPPKGTRFDRMASYRDRYWNEANMRAVRELTAAAIADDSSLLSVAIRWLVHHTRTNALIVGASNVRQLEENLAAAEQGPLSPHILTAIDATWEQLRGPSPKYNRD